jgi:hypothetical protein
MSLTSYHCSTPQRITLFLSALGIITVRLASVKQSASEKQRPPDFPVAWRLERR